MTPKPKIKTGVRRRTDTPPINPSTRGDQTVALSVASDPELLEKAMQDCDADMYSVNDTSHYYVKTWRDRHEAVKWDVMNLAPHREVLPLDAVNIKVIGSSLKAGGYRGAQKYMSAIKQLRVSQGFAWSDLLELSARRFNMSTSRGIGPARQSEPLPLNKVITNH